MLRPMLPRRPLLLALLSTALLAPAQAREPEGAKRNLVVALRWVDETSPEAAAPGRGTVVSTQPATSVPRTVQRVLVLNGQPAALELRERTPVQWVDFAVQLAPGGQGQPRVFAAPRSGTAESVQRVRVTPRWPGGRQPVRLEIEVLADAPSPAGTAAQTVITDTTDGSARVQIASTVQLPFGQWMPIARSGPPPRERQTNVISTQDIEPSGARELQVRVDLAP